MLVSNLTETKQFEYFQIAMATNKMANCIANTIILLY